MEKRTEPLVMWTVYDHPRDYPDCFVARAYIIGKGPEPVPGDEVILHRDLGALRTKLQRRGLVCLARNAEDDPVIVETWL